MSMSLVIAALVFLAAGCRPSARTPSVEVPVAPPSTTEKPIEVKEAPTSSEDDGEFEALEKQYEAELKAEEEAFAKEEAELLREEARLEAGQP